MKDSRVAVYTPELGATPLIHPSRIRLESPSYSLYISALETGDTGTWYCRVDGRNKPISAYHLKVTGNIGIIIYFWFDFLSASFYLLSDLPKEEGNSNIYPFCYIIKPICIAHCCCGQWFTRIT